MQNAIRDWSDALWNAFANTTAILLGTIPKVIGFLVIIIIGWIIASVIAKIINTILNTIRFNDLSERSGFSSFVNNVGLKTDASGFISLVVKWFIRLIVLIAAFDALGLPQVSDVLRQFVLWIPNLIVALIIIVIGGLAANALSGLVLGAAKNAQLGNPELLATITRVAVWGFTIVIAVNQIGVAQTIVNTLFTAVVGALALAVGLAFGLGGRETAAEIVKRWYEGRK
ncbi:MAG: small-conductance mechanosensitive ion channel [Acidobacteria bacterium]|nr:MAG: small-conductance mechanosensitive ion channel [Acidobacteriota bacterium]